MKFVCATCGEEHDAAEISFGADAPLQWTALTEAERATSELGSDQCVISVGGETHFFVRACLDVPVIGEEEPFSWGVWVSLSEASFKEMSAKWESPDRVNDGPYFGWLCTRIPRYPDTMFMKTMVHQRAVGLRPLVELEPTEHPLAIHYREGMRRDEVNKMVTGLLHEG